MLGRLRRRRSRQHPTPEQALAALEEGRCLYALLSKCSSAPKAVGLHHDLDGDDVLVCKAHYGRLRQLEPREAEKLERYLKRAFTSVT